MCKEKVYINSPLFGKVEKAPDDIRELLDKLAEMHPLDVFQSLNKSMNSSGLLLKIDCLHSNDS